VLIDVKCPKCEEKFPVTESASEQKIDCPECGKRFTVPGSGPEPEPDEKPKSKSRDRDEPRGKKASPSRSRRDDEDDDDDRPRRRKDEASGSGMLGLLIFGGVGLIVLAIGFGVTAWLIFSKDKPEPETAQATKPEINRPNTPNNNPIPGTPPRTQPQPGLPDGPGVDVDPPIRPKNSPRPKVDEPPPMVVEPPPPKKNPRVDPPPRKEPEAPGAPPPAAAAPFIQLPGPASEQVAIGAGGKLLFFHLKANRQIAVFNPDDKKIVKYVATADDDVVLAAGQEHLIVGYPNLNKIERVSLKTFETDKSMNVPSKHPLRGLALGANVSNPLLAACGNFPHGDEFYLIDVTTMKRFDNTVVKNPGVYPDTAMRLWASQDGRTFAATSGGLSKPHTYQMRSTGWFVNPVAFPLTGLTADGDMLLGPGQLATFSGQAVGEKVGDRGKGVWYFPAVSGPYFCSVNERTFGKWPQEKKIPELQIHIGREQQPLVTFPELPEMQDFVEFFFQRTKPLDRHIFFLPQSGVVAILPAARDRIYHRPVDVKAESASTKIEYVAVASRPPSVKFGETFRYKPEVLCKKGPPTLRLDAAPVGMKLEGDTLVWSVPTRTNQPPASVILSITDAGGKELFHSFEIPVFAK